MSEADVYLKMAEQAERDAAKPGNNRARRRKLLHDAKTWRRTAKLLQEDDAKKHGKE